MKNDKEKNIHYFPGHMKKAQNEIVNYVKLVDLIVEAVDSRAPYSTRNPFLAGIIGNKKHLLLLTKSDYSDKEVTKRWTAYYDKQGIPTISGNLKKDRIVDRLSKAAEPLFKEKREKEAKLGMKRQPLRLMVIGVPNVGKSTFINSLKGKGRAKVANKAGLTRSEQWIRVSEDFLLLDTPGILPMNYGDEGTNVTLALLGTMKEDILPTATLAERLYEYLQAHYPACLKKRFEIDDVSSLPLEEAMLSIAKRRGLLINGEPSLDKACYLFVKEFKDGLLGEYSLEEPDA